LNTPLGTASLEYAVGTASSETPKALANFSPGLFQPRDQVNTININAESVGNGCLTVRTLSALVLWLVIVYPGLFQPRDQVNTININAESVGNGCLTVRTLSALVLWLVIVYPGLEQPRDQVNTININAESVGNGCLTVRQRFQRWFCGW
jgi:hypothetical protein